MEAGTTPSLPLGSGNMTFLQCDLHNASYHAEFNYESGVQNIALEVNRLEAVQTLDSVLGPDLGPELESDCFRLTTSPQDLYNGAGPCTFDPTLLRNLSYTAILDSFRKVVIRSVSMDSSLPES